MRPLLDRRPVLALGLLAATAAALALRVVPGFRSVLPAPGAEVVFRETDPWFHVRAIELQTANFPSRFAFDAYLRYPNGGDVPVAPLFDWIGAATAIVAGACQSLAPGAGAAGPSARTVELVAAWLPAILGALVVVPTARLAWRLAGRNGAAALAAAFVVATLPGQFLARSLFGFTDHHVLEVLVSTMLLAALAGAFDDAAAQGARRRSTAAAALALAALLLTWVGAASIVLLFALFLAVEFALDLAAGRKSDWLTRTALPVLGFALLVAALFYDGVTMPLRNLFAVAATAGAAALLVLARRIAAALGGTRRATAASAALLLVAVLLGVLAVPEFRALLAGELGRLVRPERIAGTVAEAAPLASLGPLPRVLAEEFAGAGAIAALALAAGALAALRGRRASSRGERLLFVWTVGLAILAWRQNRFLYYTAVPIAVWSALGIVGFDGWLTRRSERSSGSSPSTARARSGRALVASAAMLVALAFSLDPALARARFWNGPSADWRAALAWLRVATPEPFHDATDYWKRFEREAPAEPAASGPLARSRAGYSIGAWWDYGYWILRGAHRVPAADPTQAGATEMARLLVATDDDRAARLADAAGIRYLVLDQDLPILVRGTSAPGSAAPRPSGKFRAVVLWAGEAHERFLERVERRDATGRLVPSTIFYPDYYRTTLVRHYLFGGEAVVPSGGAYVAELAPRRPGALRELVSLENHPSYGAAAAALAGRDPERFRLVGLDPAVSAVPLAPSAAFRRVYGSPTAAVRLSPNGRQARAIEIFERAGSR